MERLEELGYRLDEESLELRHIATGAGFQFVSQSHYECVGDALEIIVHQLMETKYGMERVELPSQKCFVFLSKNAVKANELVILGCGAGKVADLISGFVFISAGQWARKLCINGSLKIGSVLPFLEWAHKRNIAILVLNPNHASLKTESYFKNRREHIISVWDNICQKLPAKQLAIIAHSCGGYDAYELLKYRELEVLQRLKCIAFTDAGQSSYVKNLSCTSRMFVVQNCKEWVSSSVPLGTIMTTSSSEKKEITSRKGYWCFSRSNTKLPPTKTDIGCVEISAGTASHAETTMKAFEEICRICLRHIPSKV
ncbi:hypothetical protein SELMODRAFT_418611 [Selaginella moellendorffii]|uniref:Arb2 domain-containing protein n=1 Tax=Selaginella moellendorffii TaxID=88036 RepID=D8S6K8_SELML|nr:hypothetical protein SELMODRAFT_418611 [Selaginella moellendorffii]